MGFSTPLAARVGVLISLCVILSVLLLLFYIENLSLNNSNIEQGKQEEKMVDQAHDLLETVRNENVRYYNQRYHKSRAAKKTYVYGKQFFPLLSTLYPKSIYREWFDAGCGNCGILRLLKKKGYVAYGTDVSHSNLASNCADLVKEKKAVASSLNEIPFANNSFDVIFSADVLEHIHELDIPNVLNELVRVSKTGILFLSISQRLSIFDPDPPEEAKVHVTIRSRDWWDEEFLKVKCYPNYDVYSKYQKHLPTNPSHEMQERMKNVGPGRKFWNEGNELEPWIFSYVCDKRK